MTEQTKVMRRGGLDWNVPQDGKAADAYAVAFTAMWLYNSTYAGSLDAARHATRLHVISGLLHRLSERQCNEDLGCRVCQGDGLVNTTAPEQSGGLPVTCRACAGTGSTVGRREKSLEADAQEIAHHYGLVAYFQGDPRGCSLYLVEPHPETLIHGGVKQWVADNYTRGHAVIRLGR